MRSVGLIVSVSSAVDMLMFYPAGVIMDTWGRKYAYVPSFAIQAVGMLMIPAAESVWTLHLVAAWIGLGNGLFELPADDAGGGFGAGEGARRISWFVAIYR